MGCVKWVACPHGWTGTSCGEALGHSTVVQREGPSASCSLSVKVTSVTSLLSGVEHCWKEVEQLPSAKTWLSQNSIERPGSRNWLWRSGKAVAVTEI